MTEKVSRLSGYGPACTKDPHQKEKRGPDEPDRAPPVHMIVVRTAS
jgi:hypothetical protein